MFARAESFNQDLKYWNIRNILESSRESVTTLQDYMKFGDKMQIRNYPISMIFRKRG